MRYDDIGPVFLCGVGENKTIGKESKINVSFIRNLYVGKNNVEEREFLTSQDCTQVSNTSVLQAFCYGQLQS